MAQKDPSGLIDYAKNAEQKFENALSKIPKFPTTKDTSWHDEQVKEANESFRKRAVAKTGDTSKKKSSMRKPVGKKPVAKKSSTKR